MKYIDYGVLKNNTLIQKKKKKKRLILIATGLLAATIIGIFGYAFYWPLSGLLGQLLKNPGVVLSFFKDPESQLKSTDGKTNFLLLGIDKRAGVPYTYQGPSGTRERNGFLSDTVIVASLDLKTKKAVLISIPRDTWVEIPGWSSFPKSEGKINSVYSLGDVYGFPGGGITLTKKVVSKHLGVPIHYSVRLDFEGFVNTINTLGGVDINVENTFDDYAYPSPGKENARCTDGSFNCRYEYVHFDKGVTHMSGETALKYARSRSGTNGEGSDFARAKRQQKVITAFIKKSISTKNLLDPIKINHLFKNLEDTIETDFELSAIPALAKVGKEIQLSNIKTMVLDTQSNLMINGNPANYGGAYTIIPKISWSFIREEINKFIKTTSPPKEK